MHITWDSVAKAIYIHTNETASVPHLRTESITDSINIDWDRASNVSGIEILNIDSLPFIEDITNRK